MQRPQLVAAGFDDGGESMSCDGGAGLAEGVSALRSSCGAGVTADASLSVKVYSSSSGRSKI